MQSKLQDSVRLQAVLGVYEQENVRNNEPPNYSRLQDWMKASWQTGRLLVKDVLANHLKDQSSRLVHWLRITL